MNLEYIKVQPKVTIYRAIYCSGFNWFQFIHSSNHGLIVRQFSTYSTEVV